MHAEVEPAGADKETPRGRSDKAHRQVVVKPAVGDDTDENDDDDDGDDDDDDGLDFEGWEASSNLLNVKNIEAAGTASPTIAWVDGIPYSSAH